jgi:hypothetical protein
MPPPPETCFFSPFPHSSASIVLWPQFPTSSYNYLWLHLSSSGMSTLCGQRLCVNALWIWHTVNTWRMSR